MPNSAPRYLDEQRSVLDRLVSVADAALRREGIDNVSIDLVAEEAGVSRATAFRQLGKRDEMIVAVAISRSRRVAQQCTVEMSRHGGAFAQLEAAFTHLVRELPKDPIIRELFALRAANDLGPGAFEQAMATLGPVMERGRGAGEIRTDISVDEIITWTVEQLYLAIQQPDRSEAAVVHRVHKFVTPALTADRGRVAAANLQSRVDTLQSALAQARQALWALQSELPPREDGLSVTQ